MKDIIIYTDGACKNNPGPGGYGAVVLHSNGVLDESKIVKEIVGGEKETTNNIMELTAILEATKFVYTSITKPKNLETIKLSKTPLNIMLYTDSEYSLKGIKEWHYKWEQKNFKNVKNAEIWKEVLASVKALKALDNIHFEIFKVKGHSGDKFNDFVDKLASDEAIRQGS